MTTTVHIVAADQAGPELLETLAPGQTSEPEPARTERVRYFDSFDWRLYRSGRTLVRRRGAWELTDLASGRLVAAQPAGRGPRPRFAWDFATDGLRPTLTRPLKMRALLHLVTARVARDRWAVRNRDGKIVLRLAFVEIAPEKPTGAEPLHLLEIEALRGYEKPAREARERAVAAGLAVCGDPLLEVLLARAGLEPGGYSSRFRADLSPDQPAISALATISGVLLRTLRQNEAGLRADVDTEFLHDFRVAVRRQRSALTHFKGVVDAEAVAPLAAELAALGRLTGPLRDLDVYLLDRQRYLDLIPEALRPGLELRFARLQAARDGELARLRRALASSEYQDLVTAWQQLADAPTPGPRAETPILELARRRLRKRHARVLRDGRAIGPETPDQALHRLRIQCKKLRYLLEFTAPVFGRDQVADLVSHLKGLQDNLGEFNDLSVQQQELRDALATLGGRRKAEVQEAAAVGALLAALAARHQHVRGRFAAAFADFADRTVSEQVAALCGHREASA